jgi:DNA polymerase III epsilon subunit-like protein
VLIFIDFEASSLGKHGFPIEVGWAAEDGTEEGHLIRPAPGWDDWSAEAERIHGIALDRLLREGEPHAEVAARMVERLDGHDLAASAPSWDGQWLSKLLRASGLPRHRLRLRDADDAMREAARATLAQAGAPEIQPSLVQQLLDAARATLAGEEVAHRAVDDARREVRVWQEMQRRARALAT